MTPRAFNVLSFVARHLHAHGFAPTHAEIATELGLRSPNAAKDLADRLVQAGQLRRSPPGKSRNLALPNAPRLMEISTDVLIAEVRARGVVVMDREEMGR